MHGVEAAHNGRLSAMLDDDDGGLFTGGSDGVIRKWKWESAPDNIDAEETKAKFNEKAEEFVLWDLFAADDDLRNQMGLTDGFNQDILKALNRYFELFGHRRLEQPFLIPEDPQWAESLWGEDLAELQRPRSVSWSTL